MQFSSTGPFVLALVMFVSATPTLTLPQLDAANLANQVNDDITSTTQFFEAFPTLSGSALASHASTALTALQNAAAVIASLVLALPSNSTAKTLQGALLDNEFLVNISLQFEDFEFDRPSDLFSETLGIYCSDAIPEINSLFQITGSFVDEGTTIVALPPNNCP